MPATPFRLRACVHADIHAEPRVLRGAENVDDVFQFKRNVEKACCALHRVREIPKSTR